MKNVESRCFSELLLELQASASEVASMAKDSETEREVFTEFALVIEKFPPLINVLKESKVMDTPQVRKAVGSLEKELTRSKVLIQNPNSKTLVKQIEYLAQDLGRSLGLVLFASVDASIDVKEKIGALYRELMNARFDLVSSSSSPSCDDSEFVNDFEIEEGLGNEIKEKNDLDIDDVVMQLKYGNDEDFKFAVLGLNDLIRGELVDNDWINDEGVIPILLNRLGSSKPHNRLVIIQTLRILALDYAENKEKMADVESLSKVVKSMARDVEERREAVGLLLALSNLPAVRRRIGRIQGCIVMLVAMLNGDDPAASHDSGKVLNALSSNTQNALHMAEAGYFKPLVQHLKEATNPISLHAQASSITPLNGMNFFDWCEQVQFHLGVRDLETSLYEEKPTDLTDNSNEVEVFFHKAWEKYNRLNIMFMRMTIANNIKSTLPKTDYAKEYMKNIKDKRVWFKNKAIPYNPEHKTK